MVFLAGVCDVVEGFGCGCVVDLSHRGKEPWKCVLGLEGGKLALLCISE